MKTASQDEIARHHGHVPGVQDMDPAHDIDAGKTIRWAVIWSVGIVVSWYLLYVLFDVVIQAERHRKIDLVEPAERNAQVKIEQDVLSGKLGGKSIEQAMQSLVERAKR